jgi:hypothetical protein
LEEFSDLGAFVIDHGQRNMALNIKEWISSQIGRRLKTNLSFAGPKFAGLKCG